MEISAAALFASFVVSIVGFALFRYGKKELRTPQLVTGVVMMIFPYFITAPAAIWAIGGGLTLALYAAVRAGM